MSLLEKIAQRKLDTKKERREFRWTNMLFRGIVFGFTLVMSFMVMLVTPANAAGGCTDTEKRNHMTCETNPKVTKCVLGVGAGFLFGWAGGPIGSVVGTGAALTNCAIDASVG